MVGTPLISAQHLYHYYGDHCALVDVSLEIQRGEVVGFLGLNGAGKSSTLKILSGSTVPSAGHVQIGAVDVAKQPRQARARLGYLPEQAPLYRELSVDEYLGYCARLHGVGAKHLSAAVERARQRCGLDNSGARLIGTLSKGYQQRVGIAQAIVHEPDVVLLDEPTSGLDPVQMRDIRAVIRELGRDHAVLLSSHLLAEVEAICARVLILHHGHLVFTESLGTPGGGILRARFGTTPQTAALAVLPGVNAVEQVTEHDFVLRHDAGDATAEALVERAVQQRWHLQALIPGRGSLEDVFVALTCGDDTSRRVAPPCA